MIKYTFVITTVLLCGCAKSLYFGSHTRIGVDASAGGAGIGFKNSILNITPTKESGEAFNVLGSADADIAYTGLILHEIVAVGEAAICAAKKSNENENLPTDPPPDAIGKGPSALGPVIFGVNTSFSLLDLSWGNGTTQGVNIGFKRDVGVRMPIVENHVGSAYAEIFINTTNQGKAESKSAIGGTKSSYTFATGEAAIIKASKKADVINGEKGYGCR